MKHSTPTAAYTAAEERVNRHTELWPFSDILLDREWDNIEKHLNWVASAPIAELVRWAEVITADLATTEPAEV